MTESVEALEDLPPERGSGKVSWWSRRKHWQKILIATSPIWCAFLLIALVHLIENPRGARDLRETRAHLRARGYASTLQELVAERPPMPSETDNFFAIPLLAPLANPRPLSEASLEFEQRERIRRRFETLGFPYESAVPEPRTSRESGPYPFKAWREYFEQATPPRLPPAGSGPFDSDAAWLLAALLGEGARKSDWEMLFRESMIRDKARWPDHFDGSETLFEWTEIGSPDVGPLFGCTRANQLMLHCAIASGDVEQARQCIQLGIRMKQGIAQGHSLVTQFIAMSSLTLDLRVLETGLAEPLWRETDLRWMMEELEVPDVVEGLKQALQFEAHGSIGNLAPTWHTTGFWDRQELLSEYLGVFEEEKGYENYVTFFPVGWADRNSAVGLRLMYDHIIDPIQAGRCHEVFNGGDLIAHQILLGQPDPYAEVARILLSYITPEVIRRPLQIADTREMFRIGCALERFRRAEGNYPKDLKPLVGTLLEAIPISRSDGAPIRYELLPSVDSYRLWTAGRNLVDDGGIIVLDPDGRRDTWQGDHVWSPRRDACVAP